MKEIITEAVFKKKIESSPSGGFLFFGDEDYLKLHAIKYAKERVCPEPSLAVFNDMSLDYGGNGFSVERFASAIAATPMMADNKIVVLSGLNVGDLKSDEMAGFYDAVASIEEFDFNLLIVSLPAGAVEASNPNKKVSFPESIAKLCEKLTPVRFDSVPDAKLASWVVRHFDHNGVKVEAGVPTAMFAKCGKNMFTLVNEIDKLSFYVLANGRDAVSAGDVELVTSQNEEFEAFALGSAVTEGNAEKALRILGVMKAKKIEPVVILGELSSTFSDMLAVKHMTASRMSPVEIANAMKWKSDYRATKYQQVVSNIPIERIERAIELCISADLALKNSYGSYVEIEKLICLAV